MDQSNSGDTIFILLEDGTVEYIPVVKKIANYHENDTITPTKVDGVTDVVKFTLSSKETSVTTVAIKNDGTFYDMWYAVKDSGNY